MGRAVPAASRALDILELFLDDPVLSAADVVSKLALPRTTVHELLGTLTDRSYLVVVPGQPLRYQLGVRLFQLGSVFAQQLDLAREAQRVATEVAAECGETVHVTGVPEVVHRTLDLVRVQAAHDDGAPFLDEPAGRCRPDAAAATADEDSLAAKTAHSDLPLCSTY